MLELTIAVFLAAAFLLCMAFKRLQAAKLVFWSGTVFCLLAISPILGGCRYIPVREGPYAEAGRAAIESLGVYPGSRLIREHVIPDTCGNGWYESCEVPRGPTNNYSVTRSYQLPPQATTTGVNRWYMRRRFHQCMSEAGTRVPCERHAWVYVDVYPGTAGRPPHLRMMVTEPLERGTPAIARGEIDWADTDGSGDAVIRGLADYGGYCNDRWVVEAQLRQGAAVARGRGTSDCETERGGFLVRVRAPGVKLREKPAVVCVRATLKEGGFSIGTVRFCENVPLDLTGGSLWPHVRYHP